MTNLCPPAGTACPPLPPQPSSVTAPGMDSTIPISRADWQRLMTMMENLSEQQAEMSRNQAELVAQLTRANERVRELEEQNSSLLR